MEPNGQVEIPKPLTAEENGLLSSMVESGGAEIGFNDKASPIQILAALSLASRAAIELERRRDGLIHVIGRILHICKHNPAIYHAAGFQSFDAFLKEHVAVTLGLGRTSLRDALQIYEAFPTVSAADVAEVGVVKMKLLTRITDSSKPGHRLLIEAAKGQTYHQLLQVAADKANLPAGDILRTTILIPATKSQGKMWREFTEDPQVRAYCQTEDPGRILEYLMAEVMSEWCSPRPAQIVAPPEGEAP